MKPSGCVLECRACKHREWTMEESLCQKYTFLADKLSMWNEILEPVVSVPDKQRWGYRAKTTLNARYDENGWHFGTISRDELIDIPNCPLHKPSVNRILRILRECLPPANEFPLAFYLQTSAQVVLIVRSNDHKQNIWLTSATIEEFKRLGVEGLWIHYNPSAGRRLFEKTKMALLFGEERSKDSNGLWYGPGAFQQLIPRLYNQSLDITSEFFALSKNHSVIDLYCGTGTSMNRWVNAGAAVLGVEVAKEAIECAKLNLSNATILRGACRHRVPQIKEWVTQKKVEGREVYLYVNPPRTGIEEEVLYWIIGEGRPSKIAYLSCSAGTLSKNLTVLTNNGYEVKRIIPFDFFPQTIHVECLVLLVLKG